MYAVHIMYVPIDDYEERAYLFAPPSAAADRHCDLRSGTQAVRRASGNYYSIIKQRLYGQEELFSGFVRTLCTYKA